VSEDYVWIMPGGEMGRSDLTKAAPGQKVDDTKVKDLKVHVMGDTAVANGFWWKRTEDTDKGKKQVREWKGIFQDVWKKMDGSWKLVASATSPYHVKPVVGSK